MNGIIVYNKTVLVKSPIIHFCNFSKFNIHFLRQLLPESRFIALFLQRTANIATVLPIKSALRLNRSRGRHTEATSVQSNMREHMRNLAWLDRVEQRVGIAVFRRFGEFQLDLQPEGPRIVINSQIDK